MGRKAVVLSSGGIDSTVAMAMAKAEGYKIYSLTFDYGQRHFRELKAAGEVARAIGALDHLIIKLDMTSIGSSALTDRSIPVPKGRTREEISSGIPVTYVPARNTIFLSYALAWAEVLGAQDIFIGVNAVDYGGYPDCRPEYIRAFEAMARLATKMGVEGEGDIKIHTPLISMTKGEIVSKGAELGVDFSITHSCYDPHDDGRPCGQCDSCQWRLKGFREAGLKDPLPY